MLAEEDPGVRALEPGEPWQPLAGQHYSVRELAVEWNLSADYIRRAFLREPGVLVFTRRRPGRRVYRVLRIPGVVAQRVYRRSQVGE